MSRQNRMTQALVEKNVHQQRSLDAQRREMTAFADENAKLLSVADRQSKIEVLRRQAQQQSCRNEQRYQDQIDEDRGSRMLAKRIHTQNQDLATELNREATEEQRRSMQMQRICEESVELKELENALKIAYLNKERAAQFEDKLFRSNREQDRIEAIEDQMEYDRQHAVRADADKITAQREKYTQQRFVLQRQMRDKEEQLVEARQQTVLDKEMVDDILRKINQDDENDYRKRKDMQLKTAKMVRDFEEQRQREVAAAKMAMKAEEDKMMSYNRSMMERSEGVAAKKQAKKEKEDRILAGIVEEVAQKRREEEEFTELRDMLWEEELEEKRANEQRDRRDRQTAMKREMMDANSHLLATKVQNRHEEMENEARMVSNMRRKFSEDEAKERVVEERRRQNKMQHKSLIEQQRNEKISLYDEERARELEISAEESRREEYKKKVIQEARKRLLEEHASKLQGYLPGKVFTDADEYQQYQRNKDSRGSRGYNN